MIKHAISEGFMKKGHKMGSGFAKVIFPILPQAELGPNDHREDAPNLRNTFSTPMLIEVKAWNVSHFTRVQKELHCKNQTVIDFWSTYNRSQSRLYWLWKSNPSQIDMKMSITNHKGPQRKVLKATFRGVRLLTQIFIQNSRYLRRYLRPAWK